MMRLLPFLSALVTALLLSLAATAQFVPPPADLDWSHTVGHAGVPVRYRLVDPEICETTPGVKSYSGYAEVEPGRHLFFWFFEARHGNASEAPLTVWTNGGPGSSSMIGLFQELGPCAIDLDGKVVNNPYAWNEVSNMLFLDQPIGVGFSYTDPVPAYTSDSEHLVTLPDNHCPDYASGCGTYSFPDVSTTANSTDAGAVNFYRAIQGFMGALPQYARESVAYATESYGGHYGSIYSRYILEQNAKAIEGTVPVKLETVIVINGWFDPLVQFESYLNFTVDNYYGLPPYNASDDVQVRNSLYGRGNCLDKIRKCYATGIDGVCSAADTFCADEVEDAFPRVFARSQYDVRELDSDTTPRSPWRDYVDSPAVQRAIGAYTNYTGSSSTVGDAFAATGDDAREAGTIEDVQALVAAGLNVLILYGDADYICNVHGGFVVADKINAPGYADAGFARIQYTNGTDAPGEARQANNFAFVRVYQAGHTVPAFQPSIALDIFNRTLLRKDLVTGNTDISASYRTVGPKVSTYGKGPPGNLGAASAASTSSSDTAAAVVRPADGDAGRREPPNKLKALLTFRRNASARRARRRARAPRV